MKKILILFVLLMSACSNKDSIEIINLESSDIDNDGVIELGDSIIFNGYAITFLSSTVLEGVNNEFFDHDKIVRVNLHVKNIKEDNYSWFSFGNKLSSIEDIYKDKVELDYIGSSLFSIDRSLLGATKNLDLEFEYSVNGIYTLNFNGEMDYKVEIPVKKGIEITPDKVNRVYIDSNFEYDYSNVTHELDDKIEYFNFDIIYSNLRVKDDVIQVDINITNKTDEEKIYNFQNFVIFMNNGLQEKCFSETGVSEACRYQLIILPPNGTVEKTISIKYLGDGDYSVMPFMHTSKSYFKLNIPVYKN